MAEQDLTPFCDKQTYTRGSLHGIPCGRRAKTHILGRDDQQVRVYDRCQYHRAEAIKFIEAQPGGVVVREEPA